MCLNAAFAYKNTMPMQADALEIAAVPEVVTYRALVASHIQAGVHVRERKVEQSTEAAVQALHPDWPRMRVALAVGEVFLQELMRDRNQTDVMLADLERKNAIRRSLMTPEDVREAEEHRLAILAQFDAEKLERERQARL